MRPALRQYRQSQGLEELDLNLKKTNGRIAELRDYFVEEIKKIDGIKINSPSDALAYIVNFSTDGILSQPMINFLSQNGVYVSGGSACAKGHRSGVLTEMGLPVERIDCAIRVSFSKNTTHKELEETVRLIRLATKKIRKAG